MKENVTYKEIELSSDFSTWHLKGSVQCQVNFAEKQFPTISGCSQNKPPDLVINKRTHRTWDIVVLTTTVCNSKTIQNKKSAKQKAHVVKS